MAGKARNNITMNDTPTKLKISQVPTRNEKADTNEKCAKRNCRDAKRERKELTGCSSQSTTGSGIEARIPNRVLEKLKNK